MLGLFDYRKRSRFTRLGSAWVVALVLTGCRSNAHTDLYINEMAAEIRVLEDQLYRADYDNRILREKLARIESPTPAAKDKRGESAVPKPRPAVPPNSRLDSPANDSRSSTTKPSPAGDGTKSNDRPPVLPPKNGSSPPSKSGDLAPPAIRLGTPKEAEPKDILPGDLIPPAINLGSPESPPSIQPPNDTSDKIKLPGAAQRLLDEPAGPVEEIRLDPAMTRVFLEDGEAGLNIVFVAVDADGRPAIPDCDVDISLVDASLAPEKARLGRWTVPADEVRKSTSADRVVHLKVYWDDEGPTSHQAQIHVRLRQEGGRMPTTQQMVRLSGNGTGAEWAPRTGRGPVRKPTSSLK